LASALHRVVILSLAPSGESSFQWGHSAMTAISGVEFLIWLLIAASTIAVLAKYLRIPYTVALVLGGLLLSLLRLPFLSPLQPDQRPHWQTPMYF
jgi:hypothetical protein